jgi:hypothetical protein
MEHYFIFYSSVHSIRYVIFPIFKDCSALHYCCACGNLVLSICFFFLLGGSSIPYWNTVESPSRYVACFFNLCVDVSSVICRLHNIWFPLKIPYYLVPPIVFSFRAHAFLYFGIMCRFYWNGTYVSHWRFHDDAIWIHLLMFQNSKLYQFIVNVYFCLSRCYGVWTVVCT